MLTFRTSGTEPKLKAYLEVVEHGDRARAQVRLDALAARRRARPLHRGAV